jgi:hypothetical protein
LKGKRWEIKANLVHACPKKIAGWRWPLRSTLHQPNMQLKGRLELRIYRLRAVWIRASPNFIVLEIILGYLKNMVIRVLRTHIPE